MHLKVSPRRKALAFGLLTLVAISLAMAIVAVARYPAFFLQHGARVFLSEPICALLGYVVGIVLVSRSRGPHWDTILKTAVAFGVLTGILEVVNIGIENGIPFSASGPAVALGFMVVVFTLWGVAGFRSAHSLRSVRVGIVAAVSSACICMLIAVAAGFLMQFFLAAPDPASIATWTEYKRSGWTDPHAFVLANTLDSAFTHLVVAPIVATFVGGLGALLARFRSSNAIPSGTRRMWRSYTAQELAGSRAQENERQKKANEH
jgi:hypothetical protein